MNAWEYIALVSIGIIAGMVLQWYLVRNRIMNRKIFIGRNKQKDGSGNIQDLDIEMGESGLKTANEIRQERRQQRRVERQQRKEQRK